MSAETLSVGSPDWWLGAPMWGARGVIDTILRLFEQGVISRAKARDMLYASHCLRIGAQVDAGIWKDLSAPFEELNWA
jgi:hypothetical protein